ncbi:hypothetical protein [Nocardioides sp. R-C-SC26]|uniref:hypothetical protein n=1 Tax=Nocardioides sp. R-C-SC26 TaxID=2870414 RepID=UPI001E4C90DF|nr:hypothetical protein [Nocardioides sp. R-C-SC26]
MQFLLPWTTSGLLSRSSLADAHALVGTGLLDGVVPAALVWLAATVPVFGVAVVLGAGFVGARATVVRDGVGTLVALLCVVMAATLPGSAGGVDTGLGPGGVVAVVGALAAVTALTLDVARLRAARGARAASDPGVVVAAVLLGLVAAGIAHHGLIRHEVGASSPTDAARRLVEGVQARDGVAVLAVLAPAEAAAVVDLYRANRDVLGERLTLAERLDVEVRDVEYATPPDPADGDGARAVVRLTGGTYTVRVDTTGLRGFVELFVAASGGPTWTGELADPDLGFLGLFVDTDLAVTAVRDDDRWYASGVWTALDSVLSLLPGR